MAKLLRWATSLVVLSAALTAAPQPPDGESRLPSDSEIESLTQSVLSQPEFQRETRRGWWAVIHDLLSQWLRDRGAGLQPVSAGLRLVLLTSILFLFGYALSVILPELMGRGSRVRTLGDLKRRSRAWRSLEGAAESWEEAMLKARRAVADGRFYEAVWIAHRAFLSLLDQRAVVDFAKWKTNLDYLNECPADDRAYPLFETISRAYDQVVYAHQTISSDRLRGLLDEIESARRDEGA